MLNRNNKKLYESIIRDVSKIIKKHLNENNEEQYCKLKTSNNKKYLFLGDDIEPYDGYYMILNVDKSIFNDLFKKFNNSSNYVHCYKLTNYPTAMVFIADDYKSLDNIDFDMFTTKQKQLIKSMNLWKDGKISDIFQNGKWVK